MEERIFYENSKVKVTNFTIEAEGFTMPISQLAKVSSEVVGQDGGQSSMGIFMSVFAFAWLLTFGRRIEDLLWWIGVLICFLIMYGFYVWRSNSYGVVLHTQVRPRRYVVIEGIKQQEAEIIRGKIAEAMVENVKHR